MFCNIVSDINPCSAEAVQDILEKLFPDLYEDGNDRSKLNCLGADGAISGIIQRDFKRIVILIAHGHLFFSFLDTARLIIMRLLGVEIRFVLTSKTGAKNIWIDSNKDYHALREGCQNTSFEKAFPVVYGSW